MIFTLRTLSSGVRSDQGPKRIVRSALSTSTWAVAGRTPSTAAAGSKRGSKGTETAVSWGREPARRRSRAKVADGGVCPGRPRGGPAGWQAVPCPGRPDDPVNVSRRPPSHGPDRRRCGRRAGSRVAGIATRAGPPRWWSATRSPQADDRIGTGETCPTYPRISDRTTVARVRHGGSVAAAPQGVIATSVGLKRPHFVDAADARRGRRRDPYQRHAAPENAGNRPTPAGACMGTWSSSPFSS